MIRLIHFSTISSESQSRLEYQKLMGHLHIHPEPNKKSQEWFHRVGTKLSEWKSRLQHGREYRERERRKRSEPRLIKLQHIQAEVAQRLIQLLQSASMP